MVETCRNLCCNALLNIAVSLVSEVRLSSFLSPLDANQVMHPTSTTENHEACVIEVLVINLSTFRPMACATGSLSVFVRRPPNTSLLAYLCDGGTAEHSFTPTAALVSCFPLSAGPLSAFVCVLHVCAHPYIVAASPAQVAPQYPRLQQAFQRIIEATVPSMAEELQPELDQLFDKEKNPFTENQVRRLLSHGDEEITEVAETQLAPKVRPLVS